MNQATKYLTTPELENPPKGATGVDTIYGTLCLECAAFAEPESAHTWVFWPDVHAGIGCNNCDSQPQEEEPK